MADFIHKFPDSCGGPGDGAICQPSESRSRRCKMRWKAYFNGPGKCNTCHSVTGDLAAIGAKYDPRTLQGALLSGRSAGQGGRGGGAEAGAIGVTLPER